MGNAVRRIAAALAAIAFVVGSAWLVWPNPDAPKRDDITLGQATIGRHVSPTALSDLQSDLEGLGYREDRTYAEKDGTVSQIWTATNRPTVTLNDRLSGIYQVETVDFGKAGKWKSFTCKPDSNTTPLDYVVNFGTTLHREAADDILQLSSDNKTRPGTKFTRWANLDGTPKLTCYVSND